jgi:hypothetical protein
MIEDDSWREIYQEWREIRRIKRLNHELYDLLFGSIHYIIEYSKKYNIPIKNREQLVMMSERIHRLMDEIEPSTSDESLQGEKDGENRRRLDRTAPIFLSRTREILRRVALRDGVLSLWWSSTYL